MRRKKKDVRIKVYRPLNLPERDIICLETGEVFKSVFDICKEFKVSAIEVVSCLEGNTPCIKKWFKKSFTFRYLDSGVV